MTNAGRKIVERFLAAESADKLKVFVDGGGNSFTGINLHAGDGGELAAAKKLVRDGCATLRLGRSNRHHCLSLTEFGRAQVVGNA